MRSRALAVSALLALAAGAHADPFVGRRDLASDERIDRTVTQGQLGRWRTLVDADTGVVLRMWGARVPAIGAVDDAAIAERAARSFVAAHLAALAPGSRLDDLVAIANRREAGVRTVVFAQRHRGLPVVGGRLHVRFANDALIVAGSEALPHVRVDDVRGASAILPTVSPRGVSYRAVNHRRTATADEYLAPDGTLVARRSRLQPIATTLAYDVPLRHPASTRVAPGAPRVTLQLDGAPRTTDLDGRFDAAAGPHTLTTSVVGPEVRVLDGAGMPATAQLAVDGGGAVTWSLAGDPLGDAQLSAFVHASLGKARARQLFPGLPWLDAQLQVHVNQTGFPCNAFSTGDSISFFVPDDSCENTARLADVVYHELAHSLHTQVLADGAPTPLAALREGVADYFAATITGDPAIGRGFYRTDLPVREIDPLGRDAWHPTDIDLSSTHTTGLIIAGALWDLRAQLGQTASDRIFAGILRHASDIPSAYVEALVADDDDADLGNGTPNACAIENAFGRHGLADQAYRPPALATPVVDGTTIRTVATPSSGSAYGCPTRTITRVELVLATGAIDMTLEGGAWTARIPEQPAGEVARYRVIGHADDGATIAFPANPADPEYQLAFGEFVPLWCEPMDADPQWRVTGTLMWEWAMPPGANPNNDPPAPFSGVGVLGTKVRGNPLYLDGADSLVEPPPLDATAYERVHLQFRRWLSVEDATFDQATIEVGGEPVWQNAASPTGRLDHVDREWRFVDVDISEHAARGPLAIGWRLRSDASRQLGGWSLDDVCVVGLDKRAVCGDTIVDDGEQCDDGNGLAGDGCTPRCELDDVLEVGCCSTTRDPRGSLVLGLGVLVTALRRRRSRYGAV